MIVMACTALVSVGVAAVSAIAINARTKEHVIWKEPTVAVTAQEMSLMSSLLLKEVRRLQKLPLNQRGRTVKIHNGLYRLIKAVWKMDGYYGKKNVSTFLRTLDAATETQGERPSDSYLRILETLIPDISEECIKMLTRRENGDRVTDLTYNSNDKYRRRADMLSREIDARLKETHRYNPDDDDDFHEDDEEW